MEDLQTPRRPPGAAVLSDFGLDGEPAPLSGGRGRSWRVGRTVLKPADMSLPTLRWMAEVLGRLDSREDLRVSVPRRTGGGAWMSHGWTAWRYEPGTHLPRRWHEVIATGDRLHAALRDEPEPALLADRTDDWAVADRVAWGGTATGDCAGTPHLDRLVAARRPVSGVPQLVHGDLTGNVLFAPHLPPLVIDLSPYWRPPGYASAIVIADALVVEGAGDDVVEPMLRDPTFPQQLVRALIFRAVTDHLSRRPLHEPGTADRFGPAVRLALGLAR